jgi:hypothetical protein
MTDGKGTAVVIADLMEPAASPQPAPANQVANIQTNNTLNLSSSAEAALVQRLTPETSRLPSRLAPSSSDFSFSEHEREMKRLEHRGHNERSH